MRVIKAFVNVLLISISLILTINMFLKLSSTLLQSIAFTLLGVGIDLLKVIALSEYKRRREIKMLFGYLMALSFSILAGLGFALQAISNTSNISSVNLQVMNENKIEIQRINDQIDNLLKINKQYMQRTNNIYYWRTVEINNRIKKLREEKKRLIDQSRNIGKQGLTMFDMLALTFHISKYTFMLILFLLMVSAIEYGIEITVDWIYKKEGNLSDISSKILRNIIEGGLYGETDRKTK